MIYDFLRTLI